MNSQRVITVVRWTSSFLVLAGIVLVYLKWLHVNPTTVALTLLLFILVLASRWSLRLAVVLAVAATICYNFFFLPPLDTFTIADPQNWVALLTFLSTAIIAARLSQRARKEAEDARFKQSELEILLELSRELFQADDVAELFSVIPAAVANAAKARVGVLYLLEGDRIYQAGLENIPELALPHLQQQTLSLAAVQRDGDEILIPIHTGVKPRGLLLLRGTSLSVNTAEAIGGAISVSIDRVEALEEVAQSKANKESERLRTLMIDSITHELRTPLTSIKGSATALLSDETIQGPAAHELLTIIDEESDRIDRLIGQAVDMAQLDARKVQMHFEHLDVASLVQAALEACSWVKHTHPVTIQLPTLPAVQADMELIKKVLCNLIENAAKYSADGSPIAISAEATSEQVAISVSDRGLGIEPNEQNLVFERFYRAPAHHERISGSGMGLSISRAIVERHRGNLSVVSQPDYGSVFTFTLPVSPVA